MEVAPVDEAIELLEKANADLEPESLSVPEAQERLKAYVRAQRLAAFGVAALARKLDDVSELARVTGTSLGRAKETVITGRILRNSDDLSDALRHGEISLDQAAEIVKTEESSPGAAPELLAVAQGESFNVLKEKTRKAKLEGEQHQDLARRQRDARSARSYSDELGMVNIHIALEPHVGTPIVARCRSRSRSPGAHRKKERLSRALRAPPGRCIRRAAVWLRQRPGQTTRAPGPREPRRGKEGLARCCRWGALQDPRDRARVPRGRENDRPGRLPEWCVLRWGGFA
jgi:hypothetical protein